MNFKSVTAKTVLTTSISSQHLGLSESRMPKVKYLYFFGLITFVLLLFVEPYLRDDDNPNTFQLLVFTLIVWLFISAVVVVSYLRIHFRDLPIAIGAVTLCILIVRIIFSDDPKFEILPITYTIIFMASAIISEQLVLDEKKFRGALSLLFVTSLAAAIYANLLSIGYFGIANIDVGEVRFASVLDANSMLMGIIVALAVFSSRPHSGIVLLAIISIALCLLRLITFGGKGAFIVGLSMTLLLPAFYLQGRRKGLAILLALLVLAVVISIVLFSPLMATYFDVFSHRFDDNLTLTARISEAENDFDAFLEKPLLGWGREVPGENILGEVSYGHIVITGMLARLGLVGTVGLIIYYTGYFFRVVKMGYSLNPKLLSLKLLRAGIFSLTAFMFLLGNPIFLFPPWAFFPLLFVRVRSDI